jgi:uncharacterized membrane protein
MLYIAVKFLHVIGACLLLGTGAGIAFFMLVAHLTADARIVASVARTVVIADFLFTATSVAAQPVTGVLLARLLGYPILSGWIMLSVVLYLTAGAFWLPVILIQIRMRNLAAAAVGEGRPLPSAYYKLFRVWFACGIPAFAAVLATIWLMIAKPSIGP